MNNTQEIEELLSKHNRQKMHISNVLDEMKQPFTSVVLIEPKDYSKVKVGVIGNYIEKDYAIIYICLNSGAKKISEDFNSESKPVEKIHFIDMVSTSLGATKSKLKNTIYLDSPSDMTECIFSVEKKLRNIKGNKLLVLDSISTMLVYNDASALEKFVHMLMGKVNSYEASAILFSTDFMERERSTKTIGQFVDQTVKI